ncbi:MAG: gliding motility-associated C-terminal domain-containing protein [Bacteroidota bacterium]
MNRILTSVLLLFFSLTFVAAQTADQVVLTRTAESGEARTCAQSNAGTVASFGPLTGQSNDIIPDTLFLCLGDTLIVNHTGDEVLDGDPDMSTPAGVAYGFFECPPTETGPTLTDIVNDPCTFDDGNATFGIYVYTGGTLGGTVPFFNQGALQAAFTGGAPAIFHFAPITFDALAPGTIEAEYEGTPAGSCVSLSADQQFAVAYLNEITITELTLNGCQGTFRVQGGLSELDNSDYSSITIARQDNPGITGTILSGAADHNDVVTFDVPSPGVYVISVEDGKSCGGTLITPNIDLCDGVEFELPFTNVLPGTNECVSFSVNNFSDIISAQFSVTWDPTILSISGVQGFNPAVPDLNIGNFGWQDFPTPNTIPAGVLTVSWTDNSFAGVTLADGSVFFEICFDIIGQLGDCSPLQITGDPVPFEVVDSNTDPVQLIPSNGKAVVSDNPFFVLLEQDSLTCPSFDDGSFTVTVDEGVAPYQYSWNTVPISGPNSAPIAIGADGSSSTVGNLAAGTYQVTITDASMPAPQTVIDTIEVLAGPVLGITIRDTIPSCFGFNDGSIRFVPTSDGLPIENPGPGYTFTWSVPNGVTDPGNTNYISGVPAGAYGITVTDPAGCQEIALIPLGQPPAVRVLDANTFITDASCTGGQDGVITITASGGTTDDGNFTFVWSTGLTLEASTTTLSNLNPGQYCVTITDDNGCETQECYVVGAMKVLSLNPLVTDVLCNGDATGEIFVSGATTGAPADEPYTFSWSANAPAPTTTTPTSSEITGLLAGEYIVTMTDASMAGCEIIDTFVVNQPELLEVTVIDFENETCITGSDGSVTVEVTGGTAPYAYSWSHDMMLTDSIATGLSAGNYTVDVSDINGCTAQTSQVVSAPAPPQITSLNDTSVTCADDEDGTLQVIVDPAPGTMITSIEWDNGQSGDVLTSLSPGTYIVTITADNFCTTIDTAMVIAPDPITIDSFRIQRPTCPGDENGQIAVFASGGTAPFEYDWEHVVGGPEPANPITTLAAGDYTVTVVDMNGCTGGPFNVTVEDPPTIEVVFSNEMDTSCPADDTCDGQATITASFSDGSPADFIFTWASGETTNGGTTSTAVQLCEGTQLVEINDGGICGIAVEFTVGAPDPITVDVDRDPVSCNGLSDGGITITPMGGTGPYDILWVETGETTATISGLAANEYNAIITDANDCPFAQNVELPEPDPLVIAVDPVTTTEFVSCAGDMDGVIGVSATGGNVDPNNPYQFSWDIGQSGQIVSNLAAGTYTVMVTDFMGCTDDLSYTILEPDPITFTLDPIQPPLCFGDPTFVTIDTVFGGANNAFEEYTFMVDNNGLSFPVIQPATVFAGDHIVTVEDINGCTAETTFNIASPGQIIIDIASPIVVELGDSTTQLLPNITPSDNYNYLWTPGLYLSSDTIRNPFVFPEESLEYTLTIVNENGCSATETVFVELDANRNVFIPNIFSPNGDGRNDEFRIFACLGVDQITSARLFDRWGGLLVEQTLLDPACLNGTPLWDGTKGADTLPPGVYVYMIEVEFLDGVVLTYRGDVTLIR